jgi:hypothetical protein
VAQPVKAAEPGFLSAFPPAQGRRIGARADPHAQQKRGSFRRPLFASELRESYFEAPVAGAAVEFFLFTGLACFLVLVAAGFAVLEVLAALGLLLWAGGLVCAAKVNGTMASASERVVNVFFIFFFSRRALPPAHNSILR